MRIALFTEIYQPYIGGVVTQVSSLTEQLNAMGHQTLVVTSDLNARDFHIQDGVLKCPARQAKNAYGFCMDSPNSSSFSRLLGKFRPDVLHLHTMSPVGQAALRFAGRYDLPVVFTIHHHFADQLHYLCSRAAESVTRRKQKGLFKEFVNSADVVTAASPKAKEYLNACRLGQALTVIPNQVNCDRFDYRRVSIPRVRQIRQSLNISPEKTLAMFAGYLSVEKKVDKLLEQWAGEIQPSDNLHLAIVGDGPEREPLSVWAKQLGIAEQVSFLGAVPMEKMAEYYTASDVFVTACDGDLMSSAALEATACGTPTLLPKDDYNASQMKEGVSGFSYQSSKEFAEYLRKFAALDDAGKELLRHVVRGSVENIPNDAQATAMLKAYRQAQGRHLNESEEG